MASISTKICWFNSQNKSKCIVADAAALNIKLASLVWLICCNLSYPTHNQVSAQTPPHLGAGAR